MSDILKIETEEGKFIIRGENISEAEPLFINKLLMLHKEGKLLRDAWERYRTKTGATQISLYGAKKEIESARKVKETNKP